MNIKKNSEVETLLAAALKYDPAIDSAPRLIANGKGELAKKIIEIALKNRIPIKQNPELASIISLIEVGDTIPPEAFLATAEIIAYIYKYNRSNHREKFLNNLVQTEK